MGTDLERYMELYESAIKQVYSETVLDHGRNPRNLRDYLLGKLLLSLIIILLLSIMVLSTSCGGVSQAETTTQTPPITSTTTQTLTTTKATTITTTTRKTTTTTTTPNASDPTGFYPSYILISPGTSSITSGDSQAYTVIAYDFYGKSMDMTKDIDFNISSDAGGSWFFNEYTAENAGTWKITADYWNPTDGTEFWRDDATLIVNEATPIATE